MLKQRMLLTAAACAVLLIVIAPTARGDLWNKKTYITVSEPIEVPGVVLQPGRYVMKLMDSPSDRHIVQIFNERESHIYTTALAVSAWRDQPADNTILTFYEMPRGMPEVLRTWFYPGDTIGQEFIYPAKRWREIAELTKRAHETVVAQSTPVPVAPAEPAPVPKLEEQSEVMPTPPPPAPEEESMVPAPAPAPEEAKEPEPAPAEPQPPAAPAETKESMPKTASVLVPVALLGVLSMFLAAGIRALRRRGNTN